MRSRNASIMLSLSLPVLFASLDEGEKRRKWDAKDNRVFSPSLSLALCLIYYFSSILNSWLLLLIYQIATTTHRDYSSFSVSYPYYCFAYLRIVCLFIIQYSSTYRLTKT
jgi:hypothetical protein